MNTSIFNSLINSHDFGAADMTTGVIPAAGKHGLTTDQNEVLKSELSEPTGENTPKHYKNRVSGLASRIKSTMIGLHKDIAKYAETSAFAKADILKALHTGVSLGVEEGKNLVSQAQKAITIAPLVTKESDARSTAVVLS